MSISAKKKEHKSKMNESDYKEIGLLKTAGQRNLDFF